MVTSAYQNTQTDSDYAGLENVSLSLLMNLQEKKNSLVSYVMKGCTAYHDLSFFFTLFFGLCFSAMQRKV